MLVRFKLIYIWSSLLSSLPPVCLWLLFTTCTLFPRFRKHDSNDATSTCFWTVIRNMYWRARCWNRKNEGIASSVHIMPCITFIWMSICDLNGVFGYVMEVSGEGTGNRSTANYEENQENIGPKRYHEPGKVNSSPCMFLKCLVCFFR